MSLQLIKALLARTVAGQPIACLLDSQATPYAVTLREIGAVQVRSRRQAVTDYPHALVAMLGNCTARLSGLGS